MKVKDKFTGRHDFSIKWRCFLEKADANDYPRLIKAIYKYYTSKPLNLNNPRTFNEKIQWLKLYDNSLLKTKLTDKYQVREWIKEKIGENYLVPLLGVWDGFDEINFDSLPDSFVLKCNHGSGMSVIVEDKNKIDKSKLKELFDYWMNINFAYNSLELHYKDISRKIIAEDYIEQNNGDLLDYKIHVFNGEPKIIQVIGQRNFLSNTAKECFFTPQWTPQDVKYHTYDSYELLPEKPFNLDEMLEISRILAKGFKYVRVDLYNLEGRIKFGEMTFTSASGFTKWGKDIQSLFGSWINLNT